MPDVLMPMFTLLLPLLSFVVPLLVLSFIVKRFRLQIKGFSGEVGVNRVLKNHLNQSEYHLLSNIMLPTPTGTTQIDHIVVSRYGIFVIETKNYTGWIFGSAKEAQWTLVTYRSKHKFQNPLRQNYKHTKSVAELTGTPESYIKSVIVFIDGTFKTPMPDNVMRADRLASHIKSFTSPILRDEQVSEVLSAILAGASTVTQADKRAHVNNLRVKSTPVFSNIHRNLVVSESNDVPPGCPHCGSHMTLRTNRKTGSQFWGCPLFPECRGTRQIA